MFPTPIEKRSRGVADRLSGMLPVALIVWLLPLLAVCCFRSSLRPILSSGNYWALPPTLDGLRTTARCSLNATCRSICGIRSSLRSRR